MVGETLHRGNVGILDSKAHNQITPGRNSSKVLLFWEETNLLNVTRRKLLLSPDRNICGRGKSILNHKGSRKGDYIDVQPTIKKKERQQSPKPLEAKTWESHLGYSEWECTWKGTHSPFLSRRLVPPWSERLSSLHIFSHHPRPSTRTSPTFLLRILLSPALLVALLQALCATSEAPHSIRNTAKEDERGSTGAWRCVRTIISRVLKKKKPLEIQAAKWTLH